MKVVGPFGGIGLICSTKYIKRKFTKKVQILSILQLLVRKSKKYHSSLLTKTLTVLPSSST